MVSRSNKNNKRIWIRYGVIGLLIIAAVAWFQFSKSNGKKPIIRTAIVESGPISASVSANGVLQPVTTVQVKSNVGGQIVKLAVDEGDRVTAGQLIAKIDPSDTISNLQQTQADMRSSEAKVLQSHQNLDMQIKQTTANIAASKQAVESARQRLLQAQKQAQVQPSLTRQAIQEAQSNLASAEAALNQTKSALIPQNQAAAEAAYAQAKAALTLAENDLSRKQALLNKGFISKSQVDASEEQYSVAKAQTENARKKLDTIKDETEQDVQAAQAKVNQAKANLDSAKTNQVQDTLKKQDLAAAKAAFEQAKANLDSAYTGSYQAQMKKQDIVQAEAQLQRTAATLKNAETQVGYTTITAPRSGVVVMKYVEEGSIVTAGRSSFSGSGSGVAIVDIADTTRMMALVNVDETDIAQIQLGQKVDVSVDALPGMKYKGHVTKIAPQAIVDQNVTTIPVTVEIENPDPRMKPSMNTTCDFIIASKDKVLSVPSEAIKEGKHGSTVTVLENGKQVSRQVKTGIAGVDRTEIISGLREGETVITAIIEPMPSALGAGGGSQGQGGSSQGGRGPGGRGMRGPGMF